MPISSSATATARVAIRPFLTGSTPAVGMGYRVARNKPYAGGFITEHYAESLAQSPCRCRSRSTGRSISTRRPCSLCPAYARLKADIERLIARNRSRKRPGGPGLGGDLAPGRGIARILNSLGALSGAVRNRRKKRPPTTRSAAQVKGGNAQRRASTAKPRRDAMIMAPRRTKSKAPQGLLCSSSLGDDRTYHARTPR